MTRIELTLRALVARAGLTWASDPLAAEVQRRLRLATMPSDARPSHE